jgi:hypothetical protein
LKDTTGWCGPQGPGGVDMSIGLPCGGQNTWAE